MYRLTPVAVIGGSFFPSLSGHNISEAAAAGCAILTGEYLVPNQMLILNIHTLMDALLFCLFRSACWTFFMHGTGNATIKSSISSTGDYNLYLLSFKVPFVETVQDLAPKSQMLHQFTCNVITKQVS